MIQLNLLPDVKLQFIKAQRTRRLVISIAFITTAASVGLLLLLLSIAGLQKKHLNDLNEDIADYSSELKKQPQIDKILTVQNQLGGITALHDAKPAASRLTEYLNQVTPAEIGITNLEVDYTTQTITISGNTKALSDVNKYVDTLKFTRFTTQDNKDETPAFSGVVLTSFGLTSGGSGVAGAAPATYTITFTYDPVIFDIQQTVKLSVPSRTTTRSEVEQPSDLFQAAPSGQSTTGGSN